MKARPRRGPRLVGSSGGGWGRWAAIGAISCAGYGDALARGQRYYEDNQYERALALWRDLDRRQANFAPVERVRYAYFRGMTDYRLGYREDARHWLAIAKARDAGGADGLGPGWRERLDVALLDLERETFGIRSVGQDVVQTIELGPPSPAGGEPPSDAGQSPNEAPERRPRADPP